MTAYPSTMESFNMALILAELIFDGFFYMILTLFMRRNHINKSRRLKNPMKLFYDVKHYFHVNFGMGSFNIDTDFRDCTMTPSFRSL